MTYREISSPFNGNSFAELDWTLDLSHATLIFCSTISLGNHVLRYLERKLKQRGDDVTNLKARIRPYNSVNWASYNEETRGMVVNSTCTMVVGTSAIAVGVDLAVVRTVVVFRDPQDLDELLQMMGRIRVQYGDGGNDNLDRAVIYLNRNAKERAERAIEDANTKKRGKALADEFEKDPERKMDTGIAHMVLAACKIDEQNDRCENPVDEPTCICLTRHCNPRPLRPSPCNCSGCQPEKMKETVEDVAVEADIDPIESNPKPKGPKGLSRKMRVVGTDKLVSLRMKIWREADIQSNHLLPPNFYLPDTDIKLVLDHFTQIESQAALEQMLVDDESKVHSAEIYAVLGALKETLRVMEAKEREDRNAKQREKRAANHVRVGS